MCYAAIHYDGNCKSTFFLDLGFIFQNLQAGKNALHIKDGPPDALMDLGPPSFYQKTSRMEATIEEQ